jgi:hypothetical protein
VKILVKLIDSNGEKHRGGAFSVAKILIQYIWADKRHVERNFAELLSICFQ